MPFVALRSSRVEDPVYLHGRVFRRGDPASSSRAYPRGDPGLELTDEAKNIPCGIYHG